MYQVYTVKDGDTIESIARSFNVEPSSLYKINGFNIDYLPTVGTQLVVPIGQNLYFDYYTIKKGDNLYNIAKEAGVDLNLLAKINGINPSDYIYPNQTIIVPKKDVFIYITSENDTLQDVIARSNGNVQELLRQNTRIYLRPDQLMVYKDNNRQ